MGQKIAAVQFCRRHVHCNLAKIHAGLLPGHGLATSLAKHPFANWVNQAAVFCHANKLHRIHQLPIRLLQAHQRLRAGDVSGAQIQRRLVMQHQRPGIQGPAQRGLH